MATTIDSGWFNPNVLKREVEVEGLIIIIRIERRSAVAWDVYLDGLIRHSFDELAQALDYADRLVELRVAQITTDKDAIPVPIPDGEITEPIER